MYRWCTDSWLLEIYCKNVRSGYTSYIVLSHVCKFLLYQYVLMWQPFLRVISWSWQHIWNDMVTQVFLSPSVQLSKHSCHLKFIEWFLWERLLQESTQKEITRIQVQADTWSKVSTHVPIWIAVWRDARVKKQCSRVG